MAKEMLTFIQNSPSAFQAVENIRNMLTKEGFEVLDENRPWKLEKGKNYVVTRNGTSVLAFKIGSDLSEPCLLMSASHTDCPSFKVKPNAVISDEHFARLNVEPYGGPIYTPWADRPLSVAGRVIVREGNRIVSRNVNVEKDLCVIPNVAIHMNREVNDGFKMNPQVDLLPLIAGKKDFSLKKYLAAYIGIEEEDLLNFDLFLYPRTPGFIWGPEGEYLSSHHLDNLECAYTSLRAFIEGKNDKNINVYASFDNEETGSRTRQGAASDFLRISLQKIADALDIDYTELTANSMMLSCDNAHSAHPAHPEKNDPTNHTYMNKGIVIKYNANQSYTSDGLSAAIFTPLLKKEDIPYQYFTNRSDMRGGGTLGNISNTQVSVLSLDIGLPQLAMHSPMETAGTKDVQTMIDGIRAFYNAHIQLLADGSYSVE
ncbi:MAG: M18 family aminopeptidase [Solobacterium sp.]|nr:M18 family aminopeptidase [Solobacterium sp.]